MRADRIDPVPAEQQVSFKAELPALRKELKAIRRERLAHLRRIDPDALLLRLGAVQSRLRFWRGKFIVDGYKIRAPVRLWDVCHKLEVLAELNEIEL